MRLAKRIWIVWLAATLLLLGGYEVYSLVNTEPMDTLSEAVWDVSSKYPYIPMFAGLIAGLLMGHFWWKQNK